MKEGLIVDYFKSIGIKNKTVVETTTKVKTDKIDSKTLGELLRANFIPYFFGYSTHLSKMF